MNRRIYNVSDPTAWRVEQVRLEGMGFTDRFIYCVEFVNTASSNHEGATVPVSLSGTPFVGKLVV